MHCVTLFRNFACMREGNHVFRTVPIMNNTIPRFIRILGSRAPYYDTSRYLLFTIKVQLSLTALVSHGTDASESDRRCSRVVLGLLTMSIQRDGVNVSLNLSDDEGGIETPLLGSGSPSVADPTPSSPSMRQWMRKDIDDEVASLQSGLGLLN